MSHDAILKYRQNSSAECRIRTAVQGLCLGRSRRVIVSTVWFISPPGLPIPSGSFGNQSASADCFTLYSDYYQNICRYREATSILCANQRHDDRRDCGAGRCQFSRQASPPWLIALGEVMKLHWNILLTACKPPNWSKPLPFWFRTVNAALMNPSD
jgi:hypothetical protein